MASKLVTDRQKSAELVAAVGVTHAAALGDAIGAKLAPHLDPSEDPPDIARVVQLMSAALVAARDRMVAADAAHEAEQADDPGARAVRDDTADALYARLTGLRDALTGLYGPDAARAVFVGATPQDPVVLSRFAGEVATALRTATLPAPRVPGALLDPAAVASQLDALRGELDRALTGVAQEVRQADATLAAKHAAIGSYDAAFGGIARMYEGLLAWSGNRELADKVRPSRSRPGRTDRDPAEQTAEAVAGDAGDPSAE